MCGALRAVVLAEAEPCLLPSRQWYARPAHVDNVYLQLGGNFVSQSLSHFFFACAKYVFFGLVREAFNDLVCVSAGAPFLGPNGRPKARPFRVKFVLSCTSVFGQFGVGVVLDVVPLCALCLGCYARVNGHISSFQYGVSYDLPKS